MHLYLTCKKRTKPLFCSSKIWLMMRLTTIFLTLGILQASADGFSQQKVTLSENRVSIEDVFRQLRRQTTYNFLYSDKVVEASRPVTIRVKDATLEEALTLCLKDQPLIYHIINTTVVVELRRPDAPAEIAQPIQVNGHVTDDKGVPLVGVSVQVKNSQTGTITDGKGNFVITVPDPRAVLMFTYIGFSSQERSVGNQTAMQVILQPASTGLNQIVVVGYGTQKKQDLTGAVSSANMDIFKEAPHVNILQSLHGSVPGLSVGAVTHSGQNPSLDIRGENNFSGDNTPLIVVDGIIYRGNLNDINPHDIKSVDILKGPSAEAVYGSQSSNGVILITTENGGGGDTKPVLSYSGSYSIQQPSHLVKPASPEENIRSIADSRWQASRLAPDYLQPDPNFDPRSYFKTSHIVDGYNAFVQNGTYTDWWDMLTGSSFVTNHNLSLRGNGNGFNYYMSGGYTKQDGYIYNDNYKRYSARINVSGNVTNWLNLGINSFASKSDYSGASVDQATLFTYLPFASPYDQDGKIIERPDGNRLNPLLVSDISDLDLENHLFANIHADVKLPFLEGFNYRLNFGNDYQNNRHYQFDPWASDGLGEGYKNYVNYYDLTFDNIFTYKRKFNEHHDVNVTVVYGVEKRKQDNTNSTAEDFDNKRLGYNALQLGNATLNTISTDAWMETSLYTMGRIVYTYNDKYIFTGTIRRDGFSGFGENTKFGVFPSAAAAWILSKEAFIRDEAPWLNFLKLRGSYGTTGRRSLSRYQTLAKVSNGYSYVFGEAGTPANGQWVSSLSNPDLKWETTTGADLGIDFALFNSRVNGSIDYYDSKTQNILYDVPLPQMTGFKSVSINVGKVRNHGLELALDGELIHTSRITWKAGLTVSMNRNRIVSIIGADNDHDGKEDDLVSANLFIGQPIGVIYGYVNQGMWQMADQQAGAIPAGFFPGTYKVKDLDGDGVITANDRKVLGYTDPAYRMGFWSTLGYDRFTLKVFVNSIQGGSRYYYSTAGDPGGGSGDNWDNHSKPKLWDYWLPGNPNAKYRRLDLTSSYNQPLLSQRNFVRLQNVSLAYRFNTALLRKLDIHNLDVYLSGENLLTLAPQWNGWDPETGEGYNQSGTPVLRNYTLGVNVEF